MRSRTRPTADGRIGEPVYVEGPSRRCEGRRSCRGRRSDPALVGLAGQVLDAQTQWVSLGEYVRGRHLSSAFVTRELGASMVQIFLVDEVDLGLVDQCAVVGYLAVEAEHLPPITVPGKNAVEPPRRTGA